MKVPHNASMPTQYTLTAEQVHRLLDLWNRTSCPDPADFISKVLDTGLYHTSYRREYTKKVNAENKEARQLYKQVKADRQAMVAFGLATVKDEGGTSHTHGGNGAGTGNRTAGETLQDLIEEQEKDLLR